MSKRLFYFYKVNTACLFFLMLFSTVRANDTTQNLLTQAARVSQNSKNKCNQIGAAIHQKTEKYLQQIARQEKRLRRQLLKLDTSLTETLFSYDPMKSVNIFVEKIKGADSLSNHQAISGQYLPYVDSLKVFFKFINQQNLQVPQEFNSAVGRISSVESKLAYSDQIKQALMQRREQLREYLIQHNKLPSSVTKSFKQYSREIHYYSEEIKQLKESFGSPDKALHTALRIANRTAIFKNFMQRHSFLAQFFGGAIQDNSIAGNQAITGMITRQQLTENLNSLLGSNNLEAILTSTVNNNSANGNSNFSTSSTQGSIEGSAAANNLDNYKPNEMKTKKTGQRFEYGTNFQTRRGSNYFPVTTDLALSIGYKLNNKSIIGIGAAYKLGLGQSINNIRITSEGMGLRSFLDYQLKGTFFVTGGFEYNYQQPLTGANAVYFNNNWASSGLVGVTKTVKINTKYFKSSKIQLLWDFLGKYQQPQRQQLLFRFGYNF